MASAISTSLGVDLSAVRVHTDANAVAMAGALGARAFTVGSEIVLGRGERASDLPLMAHEAAHVLQQNGAPRIQLWSGLGGDRYEREAQRAASAVVRGEPFTVRERATPHVQRLGISDALDYFADKANLIPGYRMLTILIGVNPINMSRVERTAANILRAIVEFIPGGALITQALDKYGVFERAGAWIEQQLNTLGISGAMFRAALDRFLDSLSWRDIFHLGDVWDRAKRIFTEPITRIINFVVSLGAGILRLIRDAILRPLAKLAEGTRGYDLLKAVLGQDPITGEPVPRNAETLIGGFMKLIGQEEVWANIKKANAIGRAWQWFQGALEGLLGFVRAIPKMFISALHELEIADIVLLPRAFAKVGRAFLGFIGNFLSWGLRQVLSLLQIIFEVLAPAVMPYLRKAMGAFQQIIRNPIGFVGNLVRAGVQGLRQFMGNFLSHLRRSLIGWLTGTLEGAGIYIPQAFELKEIVKFVLSVLGLTWANVRQKLLKHIPEPVLKTLETGFDIVVTLVREGPAAAWEKIKEQLSNLKDMVMEQVMSFVRDNIVTAAITKLLTSLNPAGAFIQAIIAIYNTIMFFVERLRQIAQVAAAIIDSISAIASGAIGAAAKKVEDTLAGLLTLAISFLARLVGLGRVSDAVKNIVARIRAPIDRALDHVVEWIVATAMRVGRFIVRTARRAVAGVVDWWRAKTTFTDRAGAAHRLFFAGEHEAARLKVASAEMFTEEFIAKIEAAMAGDPTAKALGLMPLTTCKAEKSKIDRAKVELEKAQQRGDQQLAKTYERQIQASMSAMAASMHILIDLLPENRDSSLPVQPGHFVTIPYKNTERKGEILVVSNLHVRYRVDAVAGVLEIPTNVFRAKWGKEIFEYVEGSLRDRYLGATPGKASATGRQVIARYRVRTLGGVMEVEWQPNLWHAYLDLDMSHHPVDAVDWWNSVGRHTGPRSAQVRSWMLDARNYILEPRAINQRRGSMTSSRYQPPTA